MSSSEQTRLVSSGVAWEAAFQAMATDFAVDAATVGERERLAADGQAGAPLLDRAVGHCLAARLT